MRLAGGIRGVTRVVPRGCAHLLDPRLARVNRHRPPRSPLSSELSSWFFRQRQLSIHQEALRIPFTSSSKHDASVEPHGAEAVPSAGTPVAWPADIQERARCLASQNDFSSTPVNASSAGSGSHSSSFVSRAVIHQQLQADDASTFWLRVKRAVSQPLSGAAAAADASFGDLQGATKGTAAAPIVYKRYVDGMTAAHHYPSRLLPASEAAQIPPLLCVTPFDLEEAPLGNQSLGFKGTNLFKAPSGMQPTTTLVERLHGRVSLLFLFDLGGQHSQLSDVAAWLRHLEEHDSFITSVYGPLFSLTVSASHQRQDNGVPAAAATAAARPCPDLASTSFLCVDHAPVWLRPLTLRSMRRLASCFNPLSRFHDYPRLLLFEGESPLEGRQRLAAEYHKLAALVGPRATAKTLVGSFLGYTGKWGPLETEALKRKRRDPFVTVLLIDRAARGEFEGAVGGENKRRQETPPGPPLTGTNSSSAQQQQQQEHK
ncbi:hypothetical protein Esti_005236 [Eimeria stiedai]